MVSYGSRRGLTPEVLEQMKTDALKKRAEREERERKNAAVNQFIHKGKAFLGGLLTDDIPSIFSENIASGPGIMSGLNKNNNRSREGSKNVIDRSVLGIKEGYEDLVDVLPDGPPNRSVYFDKMLGEYVTPEGKVVFVDEELRDAMRNKFREESTYYGAGVGTMYAIDATGAPALVSGIIKYAPKLIKFAGRTVPKYLLDNFPKTIQATIGAAVMSSSTEAEANTKIANVIKGIKNSGKAANYSEATNQTLKQVDEIINTKGKPASVEHKKLVQTIEKQLIEGSSIEQIVTNTGKSKSLINSLIEKNNIRPLRQQDGGKEILVSQFLLDPKNINLFNGSFDEQLTALQNNFKNINFKKQKNTDGTNVSGLNNRQASEFINQARYTQLQAPVDEYKNVYLQMFKNPKQKFNIEGQKIWNDPADRLKPYMQRTDGPNELTNYNKSLTNLQKGKDAAIKQIAEENNMTIEAAKNALTKQNNTHTGWLKKEIAPEKVLYQGGPDALKLWKEQRNLTKAQIKALRKGAKVNDDYNYSDEDILIMGRQKAIQKQVNNSINETTDFKNELLNNPNLVGVKERGLLTYAVDSKTGNVVNVDVRQTLADDIFAETDSRYFESDHIKAIKDNKTGINLGANQQLLPRILHRNFKGPAETFIKNNYKNVNMKDKIQTILNQAADLHITLAPDIPKGSLTDIGVNDANNVYMGYKQPDYAGSVVNRFNENIEFFGGTNAQNAPNTFTSLPKNRLGKSEGGRIGFFDGSNVKTDYDIFKEEDIDPYKPSTIPGTIQYAVAQALDPVQKDIRQIYEDKISNLAEAYAPYENIINIKKQQMEKIVSDRLNPPKKTKFKLTDLPKLITQNPLVTQAKAGPRVPALEIVEFLYNGVRSGTENDIEMKKYFPKVYDMYERAKETGVQETPKEQEYISMIDEFNRAQASGAKRLMFSVVDLAAGITDTLIPDFALKTEFTEEVRRQFSEADMAKPETFLGNLGALAIEYGIPGSAAIKFTNVLRKLVSTKKYSAFTRKTYGKGYKPGITEISNISKRAGSLGVAFGIGDFVASGPYNTLSTMFDDPLLSSKIVGKIEDTTNLTGGALIKANFKNRLRFGAEGMMIGGLFPIVGPAIGAIAKPLLLKPALIAGGATVRATGAVLKGGTYLAANTPVVKDIGQGLARGTLDMASLLGKDIIARIGAGVLGGKGAFAASFQRGVAGQLPDYKDWRIFDVTSKDPLKKGLKRFDNFLKWFRDSGNQAVNKFSLDGGAARHITSKAKEVESYLDAIEKRSYDLATGFQKRYNKKSTSPAGEKYFLEQVLEFMRGGLKKSQLPDELQDYAQALKNTFDDIKKTYASELPMGGGLRESIESNLDKYMRMSFATFNNAAYKASPEVIDNAVDFMVNVIKKNEDLKEVALRGSDLPAEQALRNFAQQNVDSIIALGKAEGRDPLDVLNRINREFVRNDDIIINTGEELPKVIRDLLGQEKNLRTSVMTTAGSLVTQTSNLRSWRETAKQGLRDGYLFQTRAEATAAGIIEPLKIGRVPGLGLLESEALASKGGPVGLYGSKEMVNTFLGTGGMLDNLLQNEFYQGLIAYKAAVQTGKTVFSPATQTRNFFSAGAFPMFNGHIGGGASVTDSFKIIMDDIFGAGKTVNEVDLIKRTQRKVELGVLDENIVASELNAILQDLKKGSFKSFRDLANAANNSKFYKQATRIYAGGDNVWKWYGHEFYMSQLKGVGFKTFDDVAAYMKNTHGVELNARNINTGSIKNLGDGLEEAAAFLLRETYPTYSKVPELIKALRKLPLGNFVSFTAEILRTGFSTSAIAMKHIASENPALREIGYRSLTGQAITLGALNQGVQGIGYAMTNVTQGNMDSYKQFFAPDYMKNSTLVPTSNIKDGVFTVFDMSRFNPYDILVATGNSLLASHERGQADVNLAAKKEEYETLLDRGIDPSSEEMVARRNELKQLKINFDANRKLDPSKINTSVLKAMLRTVSPLWDAATGTFLSIPIGVEAFSEAYSGKTREGATIWNDGMLPGEIADKAFGHFLTTIEPGVVSTGKRMFNALQGDASGSGQPIELNSEIIKLLGGSDVKIDIPGNFDFIVGKFNLSLVQPKRGQAFYSTKDWKSRGPKVLVLEYRKQNEQAFRQQYEFYKMVKNLRANKFMNDAQIMTVLSDRGLSKSTISAIMLGRYRAVPIGQGGLEGRYNKIKRNNKLSGKYGFSYFMPIGALTSEKAKWDYKSFKSFEEKIKIPEQQSAIETPVATQEISQAATPVAPVAPLPESKPVDVAASQPAAGVVDQATGLTSTESALLDRDEQLIRQRQRGTV